MRTSRPAVSIKVNGVDLQVKQVKPSAAFRIRPAASEGWQFEVLVDMNPVPGSFVEAELARHAEGNMYGTTPQGGSTLCKNGCGTVYELSPSNKATT
jgi:uncharacterized repeat protein (TIGR03803 family)